MIEKPRENKSTQRTKTNEVKSTKIKYVKKNNCGSNYESFKGWDPSKLTSESDVLATLKWIPAMDRVTKSVNVVPIKQ